jgi:hypothetical protein
MLLSGVKQCAGVSEAQVEGSVYGIDPRNERQVYRTGVSCAWLPDCLRGSSYHAACTHPLIRSQALPKQARAGSSLRRWFCVQTAALRALHFIPQNQARFHAGINSEVLKLPQLLRPSTFTWTGWSSFI